MGSGFAGEFRRPVSWQKTLAFRLLTSGAVAPGPGERASPRVPSGAPRARHVEDSTGLRPHFFQLSPRGRVLVRPRAGALPGTMALSRLWRGGDDRRQVSSSGSGGTVSIR